MSHSSKKEVPSTAQVSPVANAEDYQIAIRRVGHSVEIKLVFNSEYASMEFYDSLARSVDSGSLHLKLRLARP